MVEEEEFAISLLQKVVSITVKYLYGLLNQMNYVNSIKVSYYVLRIESLGWK